MSHTYCIIAVTYKILSQLLRYEIILKLTDSRDTVALEGGGGDLKILSNEDYITLDRKIQDILEHLKGVHIET